MKEKQIEAMAEVLRMSSIDGTYVMGQEENIAKRMLEAFEAVEREAMGEHHDRIEVEEWKRRIMKADNKRTP